MRQGTTPTLTITTDTDLTVMDELELTIKDSAGNIHTWSGNAMEVNPDSVSLRLTQADTFAIAPGYLTIQMRARIADDVLASDVLRTRLEEIIAGEVEL